MQQRILPALGAHAVLLEMTPADGSAVLQSPAAIVLRFNEPVTPVSVRVFDERGRPATDPRQVSANGQEVRITLSRPLAQGSYLVSFRVISLDSHPDGETLSFSIGTGRAPNGVPLLAGGADRFWSVMAGIDRALFLLSLLTAAGGVLFHWLVTGDVAALPAASRIYMGVGLPGRHSRRRGRDRH